MAEKKYWLDSQDNVSKVYRGVWAACIALLLIEPLVHLHPMFGIEESFGFYGWFSFAACIALVLAAKAMRGLLMRDEAYYDHE